MSSRETLQLICDMAEQHSHLPYKRLVVVNKCDGMKWNQNPDDSAFAMEDPERTEMLTQIENVVRQTTESHHNLQCKIVPASLANASVYRQLKRHPTLELPVNDSDRIGREELGKCGWQRNTIAEKQDWFRTIFQTDDYTWTRCTKRALHICATH